MDYVQNQPRTSLKVSSDQKRLFNWVRRDTWRISPFFLCAAAELWEALWTIDLWIAFEGKDTDSRMLMAPFSFFLKKGILWSLTLGRTAK